MSNEANKKKKSQWYRHWRRQLKRASITRQTREWNTGKKYIGTKAVRASSWYNWCECSCRHIYSLRVHPLLLRLLLLNSPRTTNTEWFFWRINSLCLRTVCVSLHFVRMRNSFGVLLMLLLLLLLLLYTHYIHWSSMDGICSCAGCFPKFPTVEGNICWSAGSVPANTIAHLCTNSNRGNQPRISNRTKTIYTFSHSISICLWQPKEICLMLTGSTSVSVEMWLLIEYKQYIII